MSNIEQTLSIIKPDAVERNLQNQIKQDFINKGFEIIKEKKSIYLKRKLKSFIKYMNPNHFITIYAHTYLQVLLLS